MSVEPLTRQSMPTGLADKLGHWLLQQGRLARTPSDLLSAFSDRLRRVGIPVERVTTHAPTLHPEYRWVMRVWRPGQTIQELLRQHGIEATPTFRGNTVDHVVATGELLDLRLDRGEGADFPVAGELRDEGFTQYLIAPMVFGDESRGATSWATVSPVGFSAEHVAAFRAIVGLFSCVFEICELRRGVGLLLASYVGADPAKRILEGSIRRGDVCRMRAAIMVTDMRGSTVLSERLDDAAFVERLNAHFDCVVPAVRAQGGDILKFTGDGVLAIFDAARCSGAPERAALKAARFTLDGLARLNAQLESVDAVEIGIGLHTGVLSYGNVGSGDRLDFTIIGRDINFATRLEKLCKPLGRQILISSTFSARLDTPVTYMGAYRLSGISELQDVFGVED